MHCGMPSSPRYTRGSTLRPCGSKAGSSSQAMKRSQCSPSSRCATSQAESSSASSAGDGYTIGMPPAAAMRSISRACCARAQRPPSVSSAWAPAAKRPGAARRAVSTARRRVPSSSSGPQPACRLTAGTRPAAALRSIRPAKARQSTAPRASNGSGIAAMPQIGRRGRTRTPSGSALVTRAAHNSGSRWRPRLLSSRMIRALMARGGGCFRGLGSVVAVTVNVHDVSASPAPSHAPGLQRRLLESLVWQGGASFVGQAISWAATLVVIRLLAPSDYGVVALAGMVFGFLALAFDFGVGAALVQARVLEREELRSAQSLVLVLSIGCALIVAGLGGQLAEVYGEPQIVPLSAALSVVLPIIALSLIPQSLAVRELRFDRKARADLMAMLVSSSTTLCLAWLGAGSWALVAGIAATHLTRAVVFLAVTPEWVRPSASLEGARKFIHFGSLLSLERLLWFLFTNVDVLIVGKLLGQGALGLYVVVLTLSSLPLDKISPLITQVAFPAFSQLQDDEALVRRSVVASLRYATLAFVPIAWGAALIAPEALPLLLGPNWEGTVLPFQLICAVLPLRAMNSLIVPALQGTGHIATNVGSLAIQLAVMSAGYLAGAQFGLDGVALAWLVAFPAAFAVTMARAFRALGIPLRDVLAACRGAVVSGIAMAGTIAVLRPLLSDLPILSVLVCIAAGAGVYLGLVRLAEPCILAELKAVFRPRVDPVELPSGSGA